MNEPLERRQNTPIATSVTILGVLLLLATTSLIGMAVMLIRLNVLVGDTKTGADYLIECTTPGPRPPPNTGHRCFDDGQARTGVAVKQIVDSNGNGIPDLQDLADALGVTIRGSK